MRNKFLVLIIVIFGVFNAKISNALNAATQPSFDCAKAKSIVEKAICQSPKLAQLDKDLALIYKASKIPKFALPSQKSAAQNAWLKARNSCIKSKKMPIKNSEIDCVVANYESRIIELSQSTIFENYFLSEEMIAAYAHDRLPYFRALKHYFFTSNEVEKREKIEGDLENEFKKLDDEYSGYVKSILADYGVNSIADGIKDDEKFGYLLSLLSSIDVGPITIPCDAFRAKPALISALSPVFGSSRDNFLAQSDCEIPSEMVNFKSFLSAINKNAPYCDGTMRFGIYRSHQLHIEEILLGRFQELAETTNYYHEYLENKSGLIKELTKFLQSNKKLHQTAAKEVKAFWKREYPDNEMALPLIEDNLSAMALNLFAGC